MPCAESDGVGWATTRAGLFTNSPKKLHIEPPTLSASAHTRSRTERRVGRLWSRTAARFSCGLQVAISSSFRGATKSRARNPSGRSYRRTMDSGLALARAPEW